MAVLAGFALGISLLFLLAFVTRETRSPWRSSHAGWTRGVRGIGITLTFVLVAALCVIAAPPTPRAVAQSDPGESEVGAPEEPVPVEIEPPGEISERDEQDIEELEADPEETVEGMIEVPSERTEFSESYREAGEAPHVALVYSTPVNYQDASGNWKPIDSTIVAAEGGGYETRPTRSRSTSPSASRTRTASRSPPRIPRLRPPSRGPIPLWGWSRARRSPMKESCQESMCPTR